MSESVQSSTRPTDPVGRVLFEISRGFAVIGGLVLCAMSLLTTVSVTGRAFFDSPITGDFELIALGTGVAVFAFLPYCQMLRENVVVDFFMAHAPARLRGFFDMLGSLSYGLIIALVAWRTTIGGIDVYNTSEMSMILQVPHWWPFPFAVLCLVLLFIVCVYTLVVDIRGVHAGDQQPSA